DLTMKALELQKPGYSEQSLTNLFQCTRFTSSFFDNAERVRGVCFVGGAEAVQQAGSFARGQLGLGTITIPLVALTPASLSGFVSVIAGAGARASNVGFILPEADRLSEPLQTEFARLIQASGDIVWFPTVSAPRRLIPSLQSALLVYLGLGPNNRMRFLVQPGQQIRIDEGSLEQPSKPPGAAG
ncbi:MAG TPA: hypothetical protein VHN79_07385, partial [Lacunisphaera sp.]|nr:hypothetical protein [Lacunisphaera sp.]